MLDELTFRKRYIQAVRDDLIPILPRNHKKLALIWNAIFPASLKPTDGTHTFNGRELRELARKIQEVIDAMTVDNLQIGLFCCGLFHDPDSTRPFEVMRLRGGFLMMKQRVAADDWNTEITTVRDMATGEEIEFRRR